MSQILSLSKELQSIAKNELNEIPERVEKDIEYIRTWLLKQPHIIARTDDYSILIYLRNCKFSLEKTKKKLENFYAIKTAVPEVFKNRDPLIPKIQNMLRQNLACMLPSSSDGPILFLFRTENANSDVTSVYDLMQLNAIVFDVILREYISSSVVGYASIIDLKNIPAGYLLQITPTYMKKFVTCINNAFPLRIKVLYFINVPTLLNSAIPILKSFLPTKIRNRVIFHELGGENTIQQYFPLSVLPTEYGGKAGAFEELCDKLRITVEKYQEWFLEDEQYGSIEEKRPISSKLDIDLFSIDGSFRKLEVD